LNLVKEGKKGGRNACFVGIESRSLNAKEKETRRKG